ncbi:MAG: choice-of-anchor L domain-containing protein [Flavobacterium sp.]
MACASESSQAQAIRVDDTFTANQLVQNVLANSSCIATTNESATGDTFSGTKKSFAYFNSNGSEFPFNEGIVLSTSTSQNAVGPYTNSNGEGNANWRGDLDLQQALGKNNTLNATVLEFDFTALTNTISFNYIFASNEYQLYFPCEFSDGFAFLIKEAGSTEPYRNIATIPNTTIPVSSTNIRPIIPPFNNGILTKPGCEAQNENFFNGYNNSASPINYSAQTVVLNAKANVIAGRNYHIKLVIADDSNEKFDSAVFIEAGSFQPQINFGAEQTVCTGETAVLDSGFNDPTFRYEWYKDNETLPIVSANQPTLLVNTTGNYSVKVILNTTATGTCIATGSTKVTIKPALRTTLLACGDSSNRSFFDLNDIKNSLQIPAATVITFYQTFEDFREKRNPITNSNNFYSSVRTIHAQTEDGAGNCKDYIEIALDVLPINDNLPAIYLCDNDSNQDGIITFEPSKILDSRIIDISTVTTGQISYYLTQDDAALGVNQLLGNFKTLTNPQILYVRVDSNSKCFGIYQLSLSIQPYNTVSAPLINTITVSDFSNNNAATISTLQNGNYEYSINGIDYQSDPNFSNLAANKYLAYVRDTYNCTIDTREFVILDYPNFFTPNGDGFNDTWQIKNLEAYPKASLSIFDRYGKLLYKVSGTTATWNGIFKGQILPASDYWFQLVLDQNNIIKGHFSLKR